MNASGFPTAKQVSLHPEKLLQINEVQIHLRVRTAKLPASRQRTVRRRTVEAGFPGTPIGKFTDNSGIPNYIESAGS
jgi:hypothetical protein